MKKFFNVFSLFLFIELFSPNIQICAQAAPAHMSVHEMFKDIPQDELLAMMEEGQQFIQYLEQHGTPEEKMAFAQAMEETLQTFTEDDWKEFEAIVETVQDKLPPLVIEPKEEVKPTPVVKAEVQKESKPVVVDNSLEKILQQIHKAINAILLKAKSDKILMERITSDWENKDKFNEMIRLLLVLEKKELIEKITTSSDEDTKLLLESIRNFYKRLQLENDQFVIADTFGLQADEETTAANLKKLKKIIEFFDSAIGSLLPKLVKFMQSYQPEALQKAKEHDEQAKKALDYAQKSEKQKRSNGNMSYHGKAPSYGSHKNNRMDHHGHNNYTGYAPSPATQHPHGYLEDVHAENVKDIKSRMQKPSSQTSGSGNGEKSDKDQKKDAKKTAYHNAIDTLESHLESFTNQDLGSFTATINKAHAIYQPFGTPLPETDKKRAADLEKKRNESQELTPDAINFLKKHNEKHSKLQEEFVKNTKQAHLHYEELKETFQKLHPQVDDMLQTIQAIKSSINQMSAKELDQFEHSVALKNFSHRINMYYDQFKTIQKELNNKHKLHKLERENPREELEYDELAAKVASMYGLDQKISDLQSQYEALKKSIKGAIGRKKREENKAAAQKN